MAEFQTNTAQPAPAGCGAVPIFVHPVAYVTSAKVWRQRRMPQPALEASGLVEPVPGVGDRLEEIGLPGRAFEIVSVIRPASGIMHARLRDIAQPRSRHFISLRALLDSGRYRLMRSAVSPYAVALPPIESMTAQGDVLPVQISGFIPGRSAAFPEM